MENQVNNITTVRGIPPEIWRESKALAAREGKSMGQFVAEALVYYCQSKEIGGK